MRRSPWLLARHLVRQTYSLLARCLSIIKLHFRKQKNREINYRLGPWRVYILRGCVVAIFVFRRNLRVFNSMSQPLSSEESTWAPKKNSARYAVQP